MVERVRIVGQKRWVETHLMKIRPPFLTQYPRRCYDNDVPRKTDYCKESAFIASHECLPIKTSHDCAGGAQHYSKGKGEQRWYDMKW